MVTAVVNSSPIIGLSIVKQIELLWQLFDKLYISQAVYNEIIVNNSNHFWGKENLLQAIENHKISVYTIKDNYLAQKIVGKLHLGEVETIIAAKELSCDFVIIDDLAARNFASLFSLTSIGVLGILRLAKQKHFIPELKPYLELLQKMKFRISDKIVNEILKIENEL